MSKSFKGNYSEISNIINIESTKWQRSKPKLIVVSKKRTITDIQNFIAETNHKIFAENYVQEAESKYIDLKNEHQDITVHLIGHLLKHLCCPCLPYRGLLFLRPLKNHKPSILFWVYTSEETT